jgi:branched-chain amino acid transport system permease protein
MTIRRNPLRASALGVPTRPRLIAIYTLSAAYAGAAGALLAQTTAYVSLEMLEFQRSADVLLTLIIGGTGWLYGGIAGAIAFKVLQDVLSSSAPQFWMFWMGIFLVALALVGRERLTRGVRGLLAKVVP